jgi:hypothetical protein
MSRFIFVAVLTVNILNVLPVFAQDAPCGQVPEFTNKSEESEQVKGDLAGKAQALSKLVGSAEITSQIDKERRTIYQSSDKNEAALHDHYLSYQFCLLLREDKTLSTIEKFKLLQEWRKPLSSNDQAPGPEKSSCLIFCRLHTGIHCHFPTHLQFRLKSSPIMRQPAYPSMYFYRC